MPRSITCTLAALLLLSACGPAAAGARNATVAGGPADAASAAPAEVPAAAPTPGAPADKTETVFARQLATLLAGHATLDGQAVTGVRAVDTCHTAVATAKGETIIDWSKAGNRAPRDAGGREINQLPGADGGHVMSVTQGDLPEPAGNAANRSSGAFGRLAIACAG